jgi:Xaa-Pro aminopeptidase
MILSKLKSFLKEQKLDFFLQTNSDEFFSEYLQPSEKRIEFVTNFSGSNATIIFSQNKHYFFTDGRYILQAKQQLNLNEFEVLDMAEISVMAWINKNVGSAQTLALDAKNTTIDFVNLLKCDKKILHENPISKFWDDCPKPSSSKVFELSEKITGQNSLEKRQLIAQNLNDEALFITRADELCWLLNIRASDIEFNPFCLAYAILYPDSSVDLFIEKSRLQNLNLQKVNIINPQNLPQQIAAIKTKTKKIICDFSSTNYWIYQHFLANEFVVLNAKNPIEILKAQKNPTEISGIKKGHEIDGIAVTKFLFWLEKSLEEGVEINEILVAEKILEFRQKNKDFFYPSFATIAGFASNGAVIHYHATQKTNKSFAMERPRHEDGVTSVGALSHDLDSPSAVTASSRRGLLTNSLLLVDSGGQYCGDDFCATTDITRTLAIGTPSPEMINDFTRVLKGHIALARAKFPRGTSGAQLDILARNFLWLECKDYAHGTGHGVGAFLGVHEGPCAVSKRSHAPLQENMILSNEPGFYKEGEYGIRIENLILIEKIDEKFLGFKTITLAPLDHALIDFKMLTYPEKKWLKEYHEEIFSKLSSSLENEEKIWLENICKKYQII